MKILQSLTNESTTIITTLHLLNYWRQFFIRHSLVFGLVCISVGLGSCASLNQGSTPTPLSNSSPVAAVVQNEVVPDPAVVVQNEVVSDASEQPNSRPLNEALPEQFNQSIPTYVQKGNGTFVNRDRASQRPEREFVSDGKVSLQFNNTDISEVVRTIFGELLKQTYVISPKIQGKVTFSTAKPIAESQLRYILETLLSWSSAALVFREGIFHVVPISEAVPGQLSPNIGALPAIPGYEVQIVPLKYITATEIEKLLQPFLTKDALLYADDSRRLLILAGTQDQLNNYLRTVEIFDVDWLAGMSVAIFPLDFTDPDTMIDEIKTVLGAENSPISDQIRLMPMERLNAVVVMTPQPQYLGVVQNWITRLDRQAIQSAEQSLFVYYVNNVDAEELSGTLSGVFSGSGKSNTSTARQQNKRTSTVAGSVVPGLTPVEVSKEGRASVQPTTENTSARNRRSVTSASATGLDLSAVGDSEITITAVAQNNALLIKATPKQYQGILKAIKQLDTPPLQVLIEASIFEVTLIDGLALGVEWYLFNATNGFLADSSVLGKGSLRLGAGGFGYNVGRRDLGIAISALQKSGKSKLLSSPSLWALNNESASINVGTQIPVITTSINTGGDADAVTSNVQFRDTGVILDVTPRINPGGLVYLDVSLNISNTVGSADSNGNLSVAQRALDTSIAVNDGQTIMLGGLISDDDSQSQDSVPLLSRIPGLKYLFGNNKRDSTRTEIIAILTPTVVYSREGTDQILKEYKRKFQYVFPVEKADTAIKNTPSEK